MMLKPAGEADLPNLVYAAKSELSFVVRLSFFMCCLPRVVLIVSLFMNPMPKKFHVDSGRIPEYDMKLMGIDSDALDIPETEYEVLLRRPTNLLPSYVTISHN